MGLFTTVRIWCIVRTGAYEDADGRRKYQFILQYSVNEEVMCGTGLYMATPVCCIVCMEDIQVKPLDESV